MKSLIAIAAIALSTLVSTPSFAQSYDHDEDCIACSASPAQLEILAEEARDNLKARIEKLDDTTDITEGKIRAAIINMVNDGLRNVQKDIEEFGMTSNRSLVDKIIKDIEKLNKLISEL